MATQLRWRNQLAQRGIIFCWSALLLIAGCSTTPAEPPQISSSTPVNLATDYPVGSQYMGIRLLGTVSVPDTRVDGFRVDELSGLAWDEDEQILYALSNRGKLFHLKPIFDNDVLVDTRILAAFPLRGKNGKKLKKPFRDTEGMAIENASNGKKGDSTLLISFENKPRIARFDNRGHELSSLPLPSPINDRERYDSSNHGLESLTIHPRYGVITTPEIPLRNTEAITLYALDGKQWRVPPFPIANNAVVGMETMPDGNVLLLERAFSSVLSPIIISLHRAVIDDSCEASSGRKDFCHAEPLAIMSSAKGWNLDNFEGLARHHGNRYFMVSDNNRFWLQKTLLTYFEVTADKARTTNSH